MIVARQRLYSEALAGSRRVSTRTPSYNSRLSSGARMCVSVTVLP